MSKVQDIRKMRREGATIAEIARRAGVSEPTVRKYLAAKDLSPAMPLKRPRPTVMDQYAAIVDAWLCEDAGTWKKQRHTATRVWQRLREEHGAAVSYSTVQRYVKGWREAHREQGCGYLDQVAVPADAQVDFGQADFYLDDVRTRMHYLVCVFPFSNVGLSQVFFGETAECVCEGLGAVFSYVGGVPRRIVFDNATGAGRRVCNVVRTSELFGAFCAHHGFDAVFCNPGAGHEKGSVENKVGALRRSLFVPVPRVYNLRNYNARLLDRCMELSDKEHYIKGEGQRALFCEDQFAMLGLPKAPFKAVTWQRVRADKYGNVTLDGRHRYSSDPRFGRCTLIVGKGAFEVEIYDLDGAHVATHPRAFGDRPTESVEPASQLPLLCRKPAGWPNSRVRESLPEGLRRWMDGLGEEERREKLRLMRDVSAESGYGPCVEALSRIAAAGAPADRSSLALLARGICSGRGLQHYDDAPDLSAYDAAFALLGGGADAQGR